MVKVLQLMPKISVIKGYSLTKKNEITTTLMLEHLYNTCEPSTHQG